jgi:hypothetical protein
MKDWSRRNLLRTTAGAALGAAVAVPMTSLSGTAGAAEPAASAELVEFRDFSGPVMFCVHDAERGEVSILHGTDEVIVTDRRLVDRIMSVAGSRLA